MNELTHFLTGYLVARGLKYKADRFECFFVAICALLPDIDGTIGMFVPFEHGVFTHTYIGGMSFVLLLTLLAYGATASLLQKTHTTFSRLLFLGFLGLTAHFFLDMFTFHEGTCSIWLSSDVLSSDCVCPGPECVSVDDRHHLFFWPLWNFPPHLNTIFPYPWATYELRVWIEVIYTVVIGLVLLYMLIIKRQNVLGVLFPNFWWKHAQAESSESEKTAGNENDKVPIPPSIVLFYLGFIFFFTLQYYGDGIAEGIKAASPWIATQIIFYGLFVILNIGLGLYSILKIPANPQVKHLLFGIGIVFIFLGIGRLFLMGFDFYNLAYTPYYRLGCFFDILAFTVLAIVIERKILHKTKMLFSIYGIIISLMQILAIWGVLTQPVDIPDYMHMYGIIPLLLLPFGLYLWVAKQSVGVLRRNALLIILGMLIYVVAQMFFSLLNTLGVLDSIIQVNLKASLSIIGAILCGYFLIAYSTSKT